MYMGSFVRGVKVIGMQQEGDGTSDGVTYL